MRRTSDFSWQNWNTDFWSFTCYKKSYKCTALFGSFLQQSIYIASCQPLAKMMHCHIMLIRSRYIYLQAFALISHITLWISIVRQTSRPTSEYLKSMDCCTQLWCKQLLHQMVQHPDCTLIWYSLWTWISRRSSRIFEALYFISIPQCCSNMGSAFQTCGQSNNYCKYRHELFFWWSQCSTLCQWEIDAAHHSFIGVSGCDCFFCWSSCFFDSFEKNWRTKRQLFPVQHRGLSFKFNWLLSWAVSECFCFVKACVQIGHIFTTFSKFTNPPNIQFAEVF